jgi:hypothetical protein
LKKLILVFYIVINILYAYNPPAEPELEPEPIWVGVLQKSNICKKEAISIYMDDENSYNGNYQHGWKDPIKSTKFGTTYNFCKVDGSKFKPLSTNENYAVLKLDNKCPKNSVEIYRLWDNEDSNNGNSAINFSSVRNFKLFFCYFKGTSIKKDFTMDKFPTFPKYLRGNYGVLYYDKSSFKLNILFKGKVYQDDENDRNINKLFLPDNISKDDFKLIEGENDTLIHYAEINPDPESVSAKKYRKLNIKIEQGYFDYKEGITLEYYVNDQKVYIYEIKDLLSETSDLAAVVSAINGIRFPSNVTKIVVVYFLSIDDNEKVEKTIDVTQFDKDLDEINFIL